MMLTTTPSDARMLLGKKLAYGKPATQNKNGVGMLKECTSAREVFDNYRAVRQRIAQWKPRESLPPSPVPEPVITPRRRTVVGMLKEVAIQHIVARHYNTTRMDILSDSRIKEHTRPRHVAIFLSRKLTNHSLPQVGRAFGRRDHTTILNAVNRITTLMERDPGFRDNITILKWRCETVLKGGDNGNGTGVS